MKRLTDWRLTIRRLEYHPALGGEGGSPSKRALKLRRHADEMRQRVGLCLLHDVCAMRLNGQLTGPEFIRNLLVKQSRDHQVQHFRFARRERGEAFAKVRKRRTLAPESAIVSDGLLNRVQQVLAANRLGRELQCSFFHRTHRHRNIAVPGNENDWKVDVRFVQFALKVKAVQTWHPHVEDKTGGRIRALG